MFLLKKFALFSAKRNIYISKTVNIDEWVTATACQVCLQHVNCTSFEKHI